MPQSSPHRSGVDRADHATSNSKGLDNSSERMGLLSLTLAPSPDIRWILPARIRNSRSNDVVFIGSTYIQLREFHANGLPRLSDGIARLDFGTQILGAKVISAKVEMIPTLDAILDQEYDEERYIIDGKPCTDGQPPQIVVIATASNDLIYVYAKDSVDGKSVAFVYAKRALLGSIVNSEQHPRHMAIDPEIMAIGSHSTFAVFSLKEVDQLTNSIDAWRSDMPLSFQPNHEQRMLQVDGHILKMDFLQPTEQEPDKVILLLIVVKAGASHLLIYKWDTREPLDQMQPVTEPPQVLQDEDGFPLLLIPSRKCASFILITEYGYSFISNSKYTGTERRAISLNKDPRWRPKQLWVQWAKPWRHERYSNVTEDILLMREDGLLLVTQRTMSTNMITKYEPGALKTSIDTAICMLPGPRHLGGDILIAAGSMSDGGVHHLPPRKEVYMLQVIPNATPIQDMIVLNSGINKKQDIRARRTFALAGQTKASSPSELRLGYEAQIGWNLPLCHDSPVIRMWVLEHTKSGSLFIITSHLEHTSAISFGLQSEQFAEMDPSVFRGLQLDEPTFAAGMVLGDVSVQITSKYIAVGIETESPVLEPIDECICATIDTAESIFAIARRGVVANNIQVGLICRSTAKLSIVSSQPLDIPNLRPLCLELFRLFDHQYLCVGSLDGSVEIFSISSEGEFIFKNRLKPKGNEVSAVTSMVALCHAGIPRMILLTGTRDGKVRALKVSLVVEHDVVRIDCEVDREYQIDVKPVTVVRAGSSIGRSTISALVQSEFRLDQITSFRNASGTEYTLNSIWMTERNNLLFKQPEITALQSVQNLQSPSNGIPKNFLMCASRGEILFAEVVEQEQTIPRRVSFNGQGARLMMYSSYLNKLVVASNPTESTWENDKNNEKCVRYPLLRVVDPDYLSDKPEPDNAIVLGDQDEAVTALLPWEPSDGNTHRSLIVISLHGEMASRLGCISQKRLSSSFASATFKTIMTFPKKKIHTVCGMDLSSLVISVDRELVILKYHFPSKKWHEEARYGLASPARSLSSRGSVVYAATESHSIVVLRWQRTAKRFDTVFRDHAAKNTRTVIPFGHNGDHVLFTMASGQGTSVSAFSIQKSSANKQSPLFEADMPLAIGKLVQIPSSWTATTQYAFQGVASDGTVYVFQTLTHNEWRLLRFLEQLAQPDPAKSMKKTSALMTKKMSKKYFRAAKEGKVNHHVPKKMHVHGDVLKRLIEQGPSNLHSLLSTRVKREEDDMSVDGETDLNSKLEALATPIIGKTDDMPAAVVAWTKRLLRATVF